MIYHISAEEVEKVYTTCLRHFKKSIKPEWSPDEKRFFFADLLKEKIYKKLCERYFLSVKKDEQKLLRKMINDYLMVAKEKKYKHFALCQQLRFSVIEPFEKNTLLPRATKKSGNPSQVANHVKSLFG